MMIIFKYQGNQEQVEQTAVPREGEWVRWSDGTRLVVKDVEWFFTSRKYVLITLGR